MKKGSLSIRKKILLASKLMGVILLVSYVLSAGMPFDEDISFAFWLLFVAALICVFDLWMVHAVSKPVSAINDAARDMAKLDFSRRCEVEGRDELGELSGSLNAMAESLQEAFSKLEHVNRMLGEDVEQKERLLAERKELADHLSHEMKTPLSVIRAYAEGMLDAEDDGKRRRYSEVIIAETERMGSLITTLLDLSALESGAAQLAPERFDFVEFLETVAGRLLIDIPDADFDLRYDLPDHAVCVDLDRRRMEQVLNNLIINAKKNVRPGGVLKLSLREREGMLDFAVYNQGEQIPQENLSDIWMKFYRVKNTKYAGSGLGLAAAAQILSMHGAAYGAENVPEGVTFYFSVPVAK